MGPILNHYMVLRQYMYVHHGWGIQSDNFSITTALVKPNLPVSCLNIKAWILLHYISRFHFNHICQIFSSQNKINQGLINLCLPFVFFLLFGELPADLTHGRIILYYMSMFNPMPSISISHWSSILVIIHSKKMTNPSIVNLKVVFIASIFIVRSINVHVLALTSSQG